MGKIYAGMIAYNEEWIIECSLKSIYEHVDEIIVIDGSPYGPSTDRTVQIAKSIGPKVKVFSGTFRDSTTNCDPEKIQRQALLDKMEKGKDNWYIIQDADEVWNDENIKRLINYLRHSVHEKTRIIAYPHIQFMRDCWHYYFRKDKHRYAKKKYCSKPKPHNALRLLPGIKYFDYCTVGVSRDSRRFTTILDNVSFFHYCSALPKEKFLYKMRWRFLYIHKRKPEEYEKYYKEVVIRKWEELQKLASSNEFEVRVYDGPQPKWIQPLIGTLWKR